MRRRSSAGITTMPSVPKTRVLRFLLSAFPENRPENPSVSLSTRHTRSYFVRKTLLSILNCTKSGPPLSTTTQQPSTSMVTYFRNEAWCLPSSLYSNKRFSGKRCLQSLRMSCDKSMSSSRHVMKRKPTSTTSHGMR